MTSKVSPLLSRKHNLQDNVRFQNNISTSRSVTNSKLPLSMGTAASSNGHYIPPRSSSLPGGDDISTARNYRYYPKMNIDRILYNTDKTFTNSSRLKTSPRTNLRGPMKADHNIGNLHNNGLSPATKYKQLRPLLQHKSLSLTDLTSLDNKKSPSSTNNTSQEKNRYGFGFTKTSDISDNILQSGKNLSKRSEELMNSAKQRLARLADGSSSTFRNCSSISSNDIPTITDRIKRINALNSDKYMDRNSSKESRSKSNDEVENALSSKRIRTRARRSSLESETTLGHKQEDLSTSEQPSRSLQRRHTFSGSKQSYSSGLTGLRNLGNTCFMNCILQCLCKTQLLREYFCHGNYKKDLNEAHAPTKGKLAIVFAALINNMWYKNDEFISPNSLKSEVQSYARTFSGSNQQDAQEFLRFFIEGVHDDLNVVRKKPNLPTIDDSNMSDSEKASLYWQQYLTRECSTIQDVFVGQLKSILTCTTCFHRSVTYDPFWDLSLPIPRSGGSDIEITKCFEVFTQDEILDGDEKPTCEKCKRRRKCTKRFLIERFPKVLVIHLKRFSGHRYRTKLDTKVNFPFLLQLDSFTANTSSSNVLYSLYGVANHMGGTYGGHYTSYCKHPDTSKWHVYNDSRVNEISNSRVVSTSAYVLFYKLQLTKDS